MAKSSRWYLSVHYEKVKQYSFLCSSLNFFFSQKLLKKVYFNMAVNGGDERNIFAQITFEFTNSWRRNVAIPLPLCFH